MPFKNYPPVERALMIAVLCVFVACCAALPAAVIALQAVD